MKIFTLAVLTTTFFLHPLTVFAYKGEASFEVSQYRNRPSRHNCGDCHKLIAEQFKRSAHAFSYTNLYYQKAIAKLSNRKKGKCNTCHLPSPLFFNGDKPLLKSASVDKKDGIICVTCHQTKESEMIGPIDAVASPHKSKKSKVFDSSKICLACHGKGKDFNLGRSWKAGEYQDINCAECHMPLYNGKAVEHFSFVNSPEREIGSHDFPASSNVDILKNAIEVDVFIKDKRVNIKISNGGAGHLVPGGRYRVLVVTASTLDNNDNFKTFFTKNISFDNKNRIAPNKSILLASKLPASNKILVEVEYTNEHSLSTTLQTIYKEAFYVE